MTELIPPGAPEFTERFRRFRYSAFRLETLSSYGNSGEDADFEAFVNGRPKPPNPDHEQWQEIVSANTAAGRTMQRVHVVTEPLTDYLRLELTWGYGPNAAAGEDIRIIPVREGEQWPVDVPEATDFWLFDSRELLVMAYAEDGTWLGVDRVTDPGRIVLACHWRDAALHQAVPWTRYVSARPDLARHVSGPAMVS